jgi:hypothetical protein
MKYLFILKVYLSIAYKVYWQSRRYTYRLFEELDKLHEVKNFKLSEGQKNRILFYTAQCFITASWTCALRGKPLTREEKQNVVYLGAITPILDDLTDTLKLNSSEILDLLRSSKNADNYEVLIARYLYNKLQRFHNEPFNKVFEKALVSQDASIQQLEEKKLDETELKKIAQEKGGMFVLLYRVILSPKLNPNEKEALFTLGYALQQINDMFDIYKDHVNKQQTSFTNSEDIKMNWQEYQSTLSQLIAQFNSLGYNKKNIEKCLTEISTITSRGMLCLNQLMALQKGQNQFNIERFTREQLICDMEKPKNIFKSMRYSVLFYDEVKRKRHE